MKLIVQRPNKALGVDKWIVYPAKGGYSTYGEGDTLREALGVLFELYADRIGVEIETPLYDDEVVLLGMLPMAQASAVRDAILRGYTYKSTRDDGGVVLDKRGESGMFVNTDGTWGHDYT